MITSPTKYVILEGCDLSGKTTLYKELHKCSNYKWNIHDRSFLSMLVYAKLYQRDVVRHANGLRDELSNLNNRIIFIRPSFATIKERFEKRGDELHDMSSLQRVYDMFEDHDWICNFPNVMSCEHDESASKINDWLLSKESITVGNLSRDVKKFVQSCPISNLTSNRESSISMSFEDNCEFIENHSDIFTDETEGKYYTDIRNKFLSTIEKEVSGENHWKEKQSKVSRRFVFSDVECISFIQALCRNNELNINATLRSSDCVKTTDKDLKFLYELGKCVHSFQDIFSSVKCVRYNIQINSCHDKR